MTFSTPFFHLPPGHVISACNNKRRSNKQSTPNSEKPTVPTHKHFPTGTCGQSVLCIHRRAERICCAFRFYVVIFFPFLLPPIQCPILCFHCFFYPTMFWWDQHKCNANKYSVFICLFIYLPGCHMCFVQVMLT